MVNESNKPVVAPAGSNNLSLYRPAIDPKTAHTATPVKVTLLKNLKPAGHQSEPVYNRLEAKPAVEQNTETENAPPASSHAPSEPMVQQQHANNAGNQAPHPTNGKPAPKPKNNNQAPKPASKPETKKE